MSRAAVAASLGSSLVSETGSAAVLSNAVGIKAQGPIPVDENAGLRTYNVRHYGAKGDGKTLDTAAFQAAIDACTNDKGGTVLVPAGEFLIGSIELKSNVTFHLAAAARLLGSTDISHYKRIEMDPLYLINVALIYAIDAENVSLEGEGIVDGQGAAYLGKEDRPIHLLFRRCKNLTIRDVSLTNAAAWCTHITGCRYVYIDHTRIQSRVNVNSDGLHFDDCRYVQVSNCNVACTDDACGIFGNCRDVTITNCTFSTRWSVFRFGFGVTENVTVSNCVVYDTFGCAIKMQASQDTRLENFLFSNLIMYNVMGPIYIGIGSHPRNAKEWWNWDPSQANATLPGGIVRNIIFRGIRATIAAAPDLKEYPWDSPFPGERRTCINLTALDGQFIEDVTFSDVHVTFSGGGTAEEAANRQVPQTSGNEYFRFGALPAYGMYARNVRGLRLNNARFDLATPDLRPALVFDHVEDVGLNGFSAQGNSEAESLLRFTDTREGLLTACRSLKPCAAFLQVEGTGTDDITIAASDLSKAASPLKFSRGAAKGAVNLRS
jgi:polygalacturonase